MPTLSNAWVQTLSFWWSTASIMWVPISQGYEYSWVKEVNVRHSPDWERERERRGQWPIGGITRRGERRSPTSVWESSSHYLWSIIGLRAGHLLLGNNTTPQWALSFAEKLGLCRMGCGHMAGPRGLPAGLCHWNINDNPSYLEIKQPLVFLLELWANNSRQNLTCGLLGFLFV